MYSVQFLPFICLKIIFAGNMTGTIPFTSYSVKMVACTSGGCSVSPDGLPITTNEEGTD
jgi:hypothetical protein